MTYEEYISYHKRGDAGVEERMIASLAYSLKLNQWDSFRLIYFYTMTYHIPSALTMLLEGQRDMKQLHFRTDRRYVRCNGAYDRMLKELNRGMLSALLAVKTTSDAYSVVSSWYFFGRYAAFLFLEVYMNVFKPQWVDDLRFKWEHDENYTNSFLYSLVMGSYPVSSDGRINTELPLNQKIFLAQFDVIRKLAEKGPCVIVGRCADYVLRNQDNVINFFISGDMLHKKRRILERYDIEKNKAEDFIRKTDKRRSNYYNYYTDRKWGEAKNYDLCINSSKTGIEGAVQLMQDYIKIKESLM